MVRGRLPTNLDGLEKIWFIKDYIVIDYAHLHDERIKIFKNLLF